MNTDAHNHNRDTTDKSQFAQFGFEIVGEVLSATQVEMVIRSIERMDAMGAGTRTAGRGFPANVGRTVIFALK